MKILNEKLQAAFQKDSKGISEVRSALRRSLSRGSSRSSRTTRAAPSPSCPTSWSSRTSSRTSSISPRTTSEVLLLRSRVLRGLQRHDRCQDRQAQYLSAYSGKREKKSELSNFERIASGTFKKKAEETAYLTVEATAQPKRSREKDRLCSKSPSRKESSNENKLARLFSKDKHPVKEKDFKESLRKEENGGTNLTTQQREQQDESVSFSAVLATTTVKSRRRRESKEFKEKKPKPRKQENAEEEKEEGDEAFIFFRPKKGKK